MEVPAFITEKKKEIVVILLAIIILIAIFSWAPKMITPSEFEMRFSKDSISAGGETILTVVIANTLDNKVENAKVIVIPESNVLSVKDPERVEATLGKGTKREFDFPVNVSESATPGSYNLEVTVEMNEQTFKGYTLLNVKEN
ncbi:hypothetical protein K8R43_02940 [archaeon]|nr:hypothetical protein [archaeon]